MSRAPGHREDEVRRAQVTCMREGVFQLFLPEDRAQRVTQAQLRAAGTWPSVETRIKSITRRPLQVVGRQGGSWGAVDTQLGISSGKGLCWTEP